MYPTTHLQLEIALFPLTELVKLGHAVQLPDPVCSLYDALGHSLHSVPSGPVYPARHVQLVTWLLPAAENVLAGQSPQTPDWNPPSVVLYVLTAHSTQVAAVVAPKVIEYVPIGHAVHTPAPGDVLYVPFGHDVHATDAVDTLYVPTGQGVHGAPMDVVP